MRGLQLRQAGVPAILGPTTLAIRFPAGVGSAYDLIASEASLEVLRATLRRLTGQDWSVRVEQTAGPTPASAAPPPRPEQRNRELLELPLFKRAADVLGAQLVRADDGFDPRAAPPGRPPAADPDPDIEE